MPIFNKHSSIMIKLLDEKANSGTHIDLEKYAINMNFDVSVGKYKFIYNGFHIHILRYRYYVLPAQINAKQITFLFYAYYF